MSKIISATAVFFLALSFADAKDENSKNLIAGKQVEANAAIKKGDKLVAVYEKKNYLVEILDVKSNKKLKIRWIESKEDTDDVAPNELYYIGDATPTRKSRMSPIPEAYRALDKNGDGQIGLYEWNRTKYAEFKKLDKNHDGFLTPQELSAGGEVAVASKAPESTAKEGDSKDSKAATETPAPTNMLAQNEKVNETFTYNVTGKTSGPVWGTGTYSTDSELAVAVVHAGVLKDGVKGKVSVTITAAAERFAGSFMNGVTSLERQESGPGYTVKLAMP